MKSRAIEKFLGYLRAVRNASPQTLRSYRTDLGQFLNYLSPPGSEPVGRLRKSITGLSANIWDTCTISSLQKISMARKLAALRSFFKFCAREGMIRDNPARLVATPKLPKRLPSVLSAEEMNAFLDQLRCAPVQLRRPRRQTRDAQNGRATKAQVLLSATAPFSSCCTPRGCA